MIDVESAARAEAGAFFSRRSHTVTIHTAKIDVPVFRTKRTMYLQQPGVIMIGRTFSTLEDADEFLRGFGEDNGFDVYLEDPTELDHGERLAKFAGQNCYLSFGEKRSTNENAGQYFENILSSGHGSVVEHPYYSFLWYGLSRSMTHEVVRHRLASYSQVSQRYVGAPTLRFVERPEYVGDEEMHSRFLAKIDQDAAYYEQTCDLLLARQGAGHEMLSAEKKTEARKKVRQAARESLPNCVEAPMVVTMNMRSWRHFFDQRCSPHAETEIRRLAYRTFLCLASVDKLLTQDFTIETLSDGTQGAFATYKKV